MKRTNIQRDCGWEPFTGGIAEGKLRHYVNASSQNKSIAAEMFHLDGRVAAAFLEPIRLVELVLREAIHQRLSEIHGSFWMLDARLIDGRSLEKVTRSVSRIGRNPSVDKIVSDLNLGFWVGLFQKGGPASFDPVLRIKHPETLWKPALSKVFQGEVPDRKVIATLTLKISYLRNRIAHHEPILFGIAQPGSKKEEKQIKQEPLNAYGDLIQLATYMNPILGDFLLENFRVRVSPELKVKIAREAKCKGVSQAALFREALVEFDAPKANKKK